MLVPLVAVLAVLDLALALAHVLRSVRPPTRLRPRQTLQSVEGSVASPNGTTFNSVIVPLTLSKDQQSYYTVIQAGNTSFRVALDTGSADLWLISSACATSACSSVPKYQLAYQSPTFVSVNSNQTLFNASFADGTDADGFVALETVQLSNLTVPNQALGLVTSTNVTVGDQVSGLLGLGFPRLSRIFNSGVVNATPFFATMAQRGQLDYPLFGLSLTRNSSGTLALGAVDGSVVTNASLIDWNEVVPFAPFGSESNTTSYLQWTIPLSTIFVGNTSIAPQPTYPNATSSSYSLALLDVGTSGIFGPYQDVSRIYSAIAGSRLVSDGQWAVPCDVNTTLSFQFNSQQKFVLQPTDFLIGPASGDPNLCLSWPRALPPSSDGIDWQLGASFLRTVYSIFSLGIDAKEPPFVGLYPLRSPASTSTPDPLSSISAFFSSISGTIGTTLPNFPLPTPSTFSLPAYTFNTSSPIPHPTPGLIVSSGLATSTYVPVLGTHHMNVSAIPTLSPSPTLATFLLTDAQGHVSTSVSTASLASVTLGTPPGWTSGGVSLRSVIDLRVVGAVVLGLVAVW
ncbi:acid protease [Panus rudis PR-1116 ss-1]|nr:acid protease [Panus rudis PR-1116 ss-1]